MKKNSLILSLFMLGCVAPSETRVIPVLVGSNLHTTVCPAGQVVFYTIDRPNKPSLHNVTIVDVNGDQRHFLEECKH